MKKHPLLTTLILLFFSTTVFAKSLAMVQSMQMNPSPTDTRITFTLSEKAKGKVESLDNPSRLVMTIENAHANFKMHNAKLGGSNVESINMEPKGDDVVITFRTKGKVDSNVKFQVDKKYGHIQLVLEVMSTQKKTEKSIGNNNTF